MPQWLADIAMTSGPVVVVTPVLALAATLVALATYRLRAGAFAFGAGVAGAGIGLLAAWIVTGPLNLFDVTLSPVSMTWIGAAFGAIGIAIAALVQGGVRRRTAGAAAVVLALVAGAVGVNADFGQFATIGALADQPIARPLAGAVAAAQRAAAPGDAPLPAAELAQPAAALWRSGAASAAPSHGVVARVEVPGRVSGFAARPAYVYLPPAALLPHPRRLPVLVMLSGQPGSPANVIQSGRIPEIMDAFARAHHGWAPLVVAPDQLGAPDRNPMCVDSPLGESARYLTVDVPGWIRNHLGVEPQPAAWAIGGFSQGGTCAIQLGSAHPEVFGALIDVAGQSAPANGNVRQTIARGFGGSAAAYRAALPTAVLMAHAPYHAEVAVFGSGALDARYGPRVDAVAAAARAAGMRVTRAVAPGTAHDWHTVQWVLASGSSSVWRRLGLEAP